MKKLMFTAVALCAAVQLCAIESANVVGYNTKDLESGKFAIIGVQFESIDGTMDVNKLVGGLTGSSYAVSGADFVQTAPQIQVPNARGTYDVYYYITDGYYDGGKEKPGWCDLNGTIAGDAESVLSGELSSGVAMWVKDVQNSETLQQSGQVPSEATASVDAPTTFALRANAFPVGFNLNDTAKVSFSGLTPGSYAVSGADFVQTAPQIQVPNARGTYDVYYYISDGYYDGGKEKAGWCDLNGTIAGDAESVVTGDISAGQGFWTKGVGSTFTITFTK